MRSLDQWVDYIQTLHPRSIELGLERVETVWNRFRPDKLPPVIAIAGTNGKGSSVSMLESVYRGAGYRTGAFTSPHLVSFNERIRLDNQAVSDTVLIQAFEQLEALRADVSLTFFEFNTLLALRIFSQVELDVLLLEVGMGGRLDAVNVVDNDLALITSISIDHAAWLGDTREQIGAEKAGIIKVGGQVVIADPAAPKSVVDKANTKQAKTLQAGVDYRIQAGPNSCYSLASSHSDMVAYDGFQFQPALKHVIENTAGVIAALALMQARLPVGMAQIQSGLETHSLTGRLQYLVGEPSVLVDVSHNEASVLAMIEFIDSLKIQGRLHAVFGALADKNYGVAYEGLKKRVDAWYLSALEGERGQSAHALGEQLFGGSKLLATREDVSLYSHPVAAFKQAKLNAKPDDLIVLFGSFHLVGAIIPCLIR